MLEVPYPPNTVLTFLPATNSRPGPVFGSGEGVFQLPVTGKYSLSRNISPPEESITSRQPAPSHLCQPLGCKPASRKEAPTPPATVVFFSPAASSHPGPVCEIGGGVFQTSNAGKYIYSSDVTPPDAASISSMLPAPISSRYSPIAAAGLGRTSQSTLEALDLPSSAVPIDGSCQIETARSCHQSRPGPESSVEDRALQAANQGEYTSLNDVAQPDAAFTCRLPSHDPCAPSQQVLLYYQNVGGINSSLVEYQLACNDSCYDMYAFTETWLNCNTISKQLFDDTYSVYRQDRSALNSNKKSGGGVLLAVRSKFKSRLLKPPEDSTVEHLWVAVSAQSGTLFICVVYFPPDRVNDNSLIAKHALSLEWIESQMGPKDNIVILGDFNLSTISWLSDTNGFYYPDHSCSSFRPASVVLLDSYSTARLRQVNGIPNTNNRLLDLCFISEELGQTCSVLHAPTPLVKKCRNHSPLLLTLEFSPEYHFHDDVENVYYDFSKADFDGMNNFLADVDWITTLANRDVNFAASTMCSILLYAIDQFVPKKLNRKPPKPAWSNTDLKYLKRLKRAALRKHSKYRTDSTGADYARINEDYKCLNNNLFNTYQSQLQSRLKSNPKSFWRFVKDQRKETGLPSNMTDGLREADSISGIANLFRTQFSSVFCDGFLGPEDLEAATSNVTRMSVTGSSLAIHSDMVISAAKQMKNSTGCGPDGIPSIVLKRCLNTIAAPLTMVFNLSLTSGVFPECWKESYVFPVHKKGCKRTVANYRGIAALSAVSKLFELIVLQRLIHDYSHIISNDQHGFMPKRSTTTNLTTFTSFVIREMERGHQVDAIYTDLSAAFDKMNHRIAIAKYDKMGVHDQLLIWLYSYLTGRTMSVRIADYESSSFPVTSGVPQGSHLGPFLFLLYMNDVNLILRCLKLSYADDLKLYYVIKSRTDALFLQQELQTFDEWCRINHMTLNVSKCSVISFGRKRAMYLHNYSLRGSVLKRETTVKDLGVMLDSKLSFKDHVSYIVAKASSQLGFIFRFAKNFKDIYCLKALYCSLVRPLLEYSAVVWCPSYRNGIQRVEAVQRRFLRFALRHLRWQEPLRLPSYEDRCKLINLELLESRRKVAKACFVGDLLQGNVDCSPLLGLLDINTRRRSLRMHNFFLNRRSRTNYGKHEPMLSMCRVFNGCYNVFDFNVSRETNKLSFRRCLC